MQKSVFFSWEKIIRMWFKAYPKERFSIAILADCLQLFIAPLSKLIVQLIFLFCRKRYLNKSVSSNEIDGVLRVEELGVGQTLLPVVDKAGKLLIKKSGNSFCSLVISVFYSGQNIDKKIMWKWTGEESTRNYQSFRQRTF